MFSFSNYMTLNGTVIVLGVVFLIWRRPRRPGIRLRLGGSFFPIRPKISTKAVIVKPLPNGKISRPRVNQKSLNVHFLYNGHSFDAYEVLGLPAGCGWDRVESAYQLQLSKPNLQAKEFLDAARDALRVHLRAG